MKLNSHEFHMKSSHMKFSHKLHVKNFSRKVNARHNDPCITFFPYLLNICVSTLNTILTTFKILCYF